MKADVLILEFQPHLEMIHGKYHKETSLFSALDGKFCFIFRGWTRMGHSKQETTVPANNAILKEAPAELVLNFDKPMRITKLALTDQAGKDYEVQRTDQMKHVLKLVAQLDPVPNGEYKVDWRGLSEDGHPMKGTFSFTVR